MRSELLEKAQAAKNEALTKVCFTSALGTKFCHYHTGYIWHHILSLTSNCFEVLQQLSLTMTFVTIKTLLFTFLRIVATVTHEWANVHPCDQT